MKKISMILISVVIVCIISAIIYTYPKKIDVAADGIMYRLGNSDNIGPITIKMKGKIKRNIKGDKIYRGLFDIEGFDIPVPEEKRYIEVPFDRSLTVIYVYFPGGAVRHYTLGILFSNKKYNHFTLLMMEEKENKPNQKTWKRETGFMMTAPARTREEALHISKNLLPKEYHQYLK